MCSIRVGKGFIASGYWNCLKYLQRGWNRKKGFETKILKRRTSWVKDWVL